MAVNLTMDKQIAETVAVCDMVRGRKRSTKQLWLSFDEWNVWYRANKGDDVNGNEKEAPHLLEEVYNLEDALVCGGMVNTLLRNADRVKIACLAQLINVIAPIMTNANGLFRQTIYYPYSWGLQMGRGSVLSILSGGPTYEVSNIGTVPYLDVVGTFTKENGNVALFVLNRDLKNAHEVNVIWEGMAPSRVLHASVLTGDDLKAFNSFEAPKKVAPTELGKPVTSGGQTKFEVPARSYTVVQWGA
jgi:alpha-L-arabinofuranosidase